MTRWRDISISQFRSRNATRFRSVIWNSCSYNRVYRNFYRNFFDDSFFYYFYLLGSTYLATSWNFIFLFFLFKLIFLSIFSVCFKQSFIRFRLACAFIFDTLFIFQFCCIFLCIVLILNITMIYFVIESFWGSVMISILMQILIQLTVIIGLWWTWVITIKIGF